jgi:hypothetical protein
MTIIFFPVLRPLSVYGTKDSPGRVTITFYQSFTFHFSDLELFNDNL